jgi:hypothetical protein
MLLVKIQKPDSYEHGTPKGVQSVTILENYKHCTPPEWSRLDSSPNAADWKTLSDIAKIRE